MVQQSDGAAEAAPASSKYIGKVTVMGYAVGIFYPGSIKYGSGNPREYASEKIRLVTMPPNGYEEDLSSSAEILQNQEKDIGGILKYLPVGTIAKYRPNESLNGCQIPVEIGLADEITGGSLDKVIEVIELWLERKSGI